MNAIHTLYQLSYSPTNLDISSVLLKPPSAKNLTRHKLSLKISNYLILKNQITEYNNFIKYDSKTQILSSKRIYNYEKFF